MVRKSLAFAVLVIGLGYCVAFVPYRQSDQDSAVAQLRDQIARNPFSSGDSYANLGSSLLKSKEFADAAAAYLEAQKRGGSSPKFQAMCAYNAACAYALAGQKEKAWVKLREAMRLGFRNLVNLRTDADLASLHSDPEWEELAATRDVSRMSRDEAWRYDLWLLDRELRRLHYSPYIKRTKEQTDKDYQEIYAKIPRLDDDEVAAEFSRFAAGFGDGHTMCRNETNMTTRFPVSFYWFDEGVFVQAADNAHADLVGARLVAVNGVPIATVAEQMAPYISRENDMWIKLFVPFMLNLPHAVHGVGLSPTAESCAFTLLDDKGQERKVTLHAQERVVGGRPFGLGPPGAYVDLRQKGGGPDPLSRKNPEKLHWFEYLPEEQMLYCRINGIENAPGKSLAQFAAEMYAEFDNRHAKSLVFDVRDNGGGNNTLLRPLINGAIARPDLHKRGHLYIITGRLTYSACQNFISRMESALPVTFAGEPSGSKPNFIGEAIPIVLPYGRLRAQVSDLYWEDGLAWDTRQWITPHLPAPPTLAAYKANRDPAMEAVLARWKTVRSGG